MEKLYGQTKSCVFQIECNFLCGNSNNQIGTKLTFIWSSLSKQRNNMRTMDGFLKKHLQLSTINC